MLDNELKRIAMIEKVQNGTITFAEKPHVPLSAGEDVWFSSVGVGDRIEVKAVLSWVAK